MNKWQIICPVVAMAIAAMVALALISKSLNRDTLRHQVHQLGRDLIATTNSARLVRLGPPLQERLIELLASPSGIAAVKTGDEPSPIGDGQATSRLSLTNSSGHRLGIRLRRDSITGQFQVLGFWKATKPDGLANASLPFEEVLWVERSKPDISMLYLVLTDAADYDNHVRLVVRHASAAVREAAKNRGEQFNVVFFLRPSAHTRRGVSTGFGAEQLREIDAASPERAEELVRRHAWTIGELPQ